MPFGSDLMPVTFARQGSVWPKNTASWCVFSTKLFCCCTIARGAK